MGKPHLYRPTASAGVALLCEGVQLQRNRLLAADRLGNATAGALIAYGVGWYWVAEGPAS